MLYFRNAILNNCIYVTSNIGELVIFSEEPGVQDIRRNNNETQSKSTVNRLIQKT